MKTYFYKYKQDDNYIYGSVTTEDDFKLPESVEEVKAEEINNG